MPRITVVNIVAVSYSGSTWLNLVLGAGPEAFSIGELDRAYKLGQTYCSVHGENCPLWSAYDLNSAANPFVQIHQLCGKRLLIVNNTNMFLAAQKHADIESKFIWVIRDGRAVVASAMRKYPSLGVIAATRDWARSFKKKRRLIRSQPPENTLTVCYGDLVGEDDTHLKRLCDFVGMTYDPALREYWQSDRHFLGGNAGPLTIMAQQRQQDLAPRPTHLFGDRQLPRIDLSIYQGIDPRRFVDERWKQELSDGQLRMFALFGGRLNRAFGFPRALDRG